MTHSNPWAASGSASGAIDDELRSGPDPLKNLPVKRIAKNVLKTQPREFTINGDPGARPKGERASDPAAQPTI
jgi:hypothetical protein